MLWGQDSGLNLWACHESRQGDPSRRLAALTSLSLRFKPRTGCQQLTVGQQGCVNTQLPAQGDLRPCDTAEQG